MKLSQKSLVSNVIVVCREDVARLKDQDKAWRRKAASLGGNLAPFRLSSMVLDPGALIAQLTLSTTFELQQHNSLLDSGPDLLGCHCSSS